MHGHRIDQHDSYKRSEKLFLHQTSGNSPPQSTDLQNVGFVDHGQFSTTIPCSQSAILTMRSISPVV